ncbi:MAG: HNH endonuclease [Alphaproteobacteria bacterium]|nr:HNH endonuclease [Alphaproteobacteria bacterium]
MRTITKQETIQILKSRDGDSCFICKGEFVDESPTIDHWIPLAHGGSNEIENLRLAHRKCNTEKADRIPNEDGTIPEKNLTSLQRYRAKKVNKKKLREQICHICENGRKLGQDDICRACGSPAGPDHAPHYLKRPSHKCDHNLNWCWACSIGIVDRKSALSNLLMG